MPVPHNPSVNLQATRQRLHLRTRFNAKRRGQRVSPLAEPPHLSVQVEPFRGRIAAGISPNHGVELGQGRVLDLREEAAGVGDATGHGGGRGAGQEAEGNGGFFEGAGAEDAGVDLAQMGVVGTRLDQRKQVLRRARRARRGSRRAHVLGTEDDC